MPSRGAALLWSALLTTVLILTAGCGGEDGGAADTTRSESQTGSASGSSSGSRSPDAVVEPSGAEVPELGDPVGERQITQEGWTMTLSLYPLQRDSGSMVLNARVTYDKADPDRDAPDDILANDGAFSRVTGAPNGFRLIDKAGGKVYLPAKDENDSSICSPDLSGKSLQVGDEVYVSCVFGAPPEETTDVDVRAAVFGVFNDVPIR